MRAPRILLLAGLGALALPAAAATHTVTIEGMKFVPETLTVKKGDRIVWTNKDVVPHTATAKGAFDSRSIAAGKSWSHVARKPGRHAYVCTFHPGMKATLVVQ
ncbi:MAG TPA: cupredoxin family copper-binding protein [Ramlibacter sp.]